MFIDEYDAFLFDADLNDPLVLRVKKLRSEALYDQEVNPEKTALKFIQKLSNCINGKIYLLTVSQSIDNPSKVRTRKGLLWDDKVLRNLKHSNWEIEIEDGKTRLVSLIDLEDFNYKTSGNLVLNWVYSCMIITEDDISLLENKIEGWVEKEKNKVLGLNYAAIADDLRGFNATSILRYFPAENNKTETMIIVGNKNYISTVEICLDQLSE